MRPEAKFLKKDKSFWAAVRLISEQAGYTSRATKTSPSQVKVPSVAEMARVFEVLNMDSTLLLSESGTPTGYALSLSEYFEYRADVLNNFVQPRLMDVTQAKALYEEIVLKYPDHRAPVSLNKQKEEKAGFAYLTCMVNILIDAHRGDTPCNFNPGSLTRITKNGAPLRTLSRRLDGAIPSPENPRAVWEIKEYYFTTTFGSRVADGVYETQLDGMELEELEAVSDDPLDHLLIIDAHFTWWVKGKSYLCRIIDMLHMGYVDEVIFGREVVERLPDLVKSWVSDVESSHS